RGPETRATPVGDSPSDGEWFGMLLKLGTHLVHLPTSNLLNTGVTLPEATNNTFWLSGSAWQFPTYDNADVFVNQLARSGLLVHDPVIEAALQGKLKDLSLRSVQYLFLQTTGISQNMARQIERARYATPLLQQGVSIDW